MSDESFATLPEPPYYAVIFTIRRSAVAGNEYESVGARMVELTLEQPGCLGIEGVGDASGFEMTVCYWKDEAAIRAWKQHAEHLVAQQLGRDKFFQRYEIKIARVERAYGSSGTVR